MPLDLGSVSAVNAVLFVPEGVPWRDRVGAFMHGGGVEEGTTAAWLDLLDRRARGDHDWREALSGRTFPDGRASPPVRAYNDALQGAPPADLPGLLPLLKVPPLWVAIDVWGPGERAGEPGTLGLEFLVHTQVLHPVRAGTALMDGTVVGVNDPARFERLAIHGDAFADLMVRFCEALQPVYALSDGMQPVADFLAKARPGRVRHPAPADARLADYAWALTYWSPERVDDRLRERLAQLELPQRRLLVPDGAAISVRELSTGGVFLQARHVLGSETRDSRVHVETPLAQGLGLRSNHLLYKN